MLATTFAPLGCERPAGSSLLTAEIDESGYRRGKDLLRQGRNQEALAEFLKVIEKRGDSAPESHLEVGILYQQHIKDSIAAIYHYRKFRELKPNSPQADLVRQRIDAATREFASTLPAKPLENQMERLDYLETIDRLQKERDLYKDQVITLRSAALAGGRNAATLPPLPEGNAVPGSEESPFLSANEPLGANVAQQQPQTPPPANPPSNSNPTPARPGNVTNVQPQPPAGNATQARPSGNMRRHVVGKGDTLMSLALRYYGNRSRFRDIYAANRDQLPSENSPLRLGMELKIP